MAQYPFIFMFFRSGEPFALLTVGGVMKTKLLAVLLLAGSSLFAAPRVVVGIGVGGYVGPAPVVAYAPPAPGPGYAWVGGYLVAPVLAFHDKLTWAAPAVAVRPVGAAKVDFALAWLEFGLSPAASTAETT